MSADLPAKQDSADSEDSHANKPEYNFDPASRSDMTRQHQLH